VAALLTTLSTRFVGQQPDRRKSHQRAMSHRGDRDIHNKQARHRIPALVRRQDGGQCLPARPDTKPRSSAARMADAPARLKTRSNFILELAGIPRLG
jgi:hypothetical protein